jgi:hypothetical protein
LAPRRRNWQGTGGYYVIYHLMIRASHQTLFGYQIEENEIAGACAYLGRNRYAYSISARNPGEMRWSGMTILK